jgi:hypothetical protein
MSLARTTTHENSYFQRSILNRGHKHYVLTTMATALLAL